MKIMWCLALACALGLANADEKAPVVTDRNISVAAFIDAGQVMHGTYVNDDGTGAPEALRDVFMNRDGIALTYSGTLDGKVHMNIGVGGLFWKPFKEIAGSAATKKINFGPGISEASTQYDFNPRLTMKLGYFGYKYNPDAMDLGEYLLRSEAYPTVLQNGNSGGWVWLGNEYKSMGAQVSWDLLGGALRQDFMIFSEFSSNPLYDFSPSYVATWKVSKALEIGGGFSLHRWLPIKPSQTTPGGAANTYAEVPNFPAFAGKADGTQPQFNGGTMKGTEEQIANYVDTAGAPIATLATDAQGRTVFVLSTGDTLPVTKETKLTFKAVKVMGRASLNISSLFGIEELTGPFKIFGEVAVLGVQDQPYFYDKLSQRVPIMLGADIPTFRLLDLFSVQMEYLKNPYPDNNFIQFQNGSPLPTLPANYAVRNAAGVYNQDDLKWAANLQKTIITGWKVYLQVANDHMRVQDEFAQPSFMPITRSKSDWYYLVRFLWSM